MTWPAGRAGRAGDRVDPGDGRALSRSRIATALRKAGRQRNIDTQALRIVEALRSDQLGLPDALTNAYAPACALWSQ